MPLVNYELLLNMYKSGDMNENINLLQEFDLFHCLLQGSPAKANAVKKRVTNLPNDFQKWLEICDGGLLFDTVILTTKSYDTDLDKTFLTYGDIVNHPFREQVNISKDWFIFAIAVHDDVYFFDLKKNDGKVYQWDIEEKTIYANWNTFEDWLSDQIHEAIELIADDLLNPLLLKLEMIKDE